MTGDLPQGARLAEILAGITAAEARARFHDLRADDRDRHSEAGQRADEAAEAGRRAARVLIEDAFPGVSWAMIAGAAL
jgi:hypothetical protein